MREHREGCSKSILRPTPDTVDPTRLGRSLNREFPFIDVRFGAHALL